MKRTLIRLCGTALACFSIFAQKNQAKAACGLSIYNTGDKLVYIATSCVTGATSNAVKACKGLANSTSWAAPTGSYSGYCWCRKVTSTSAEIACLYETGAYLTKRNTLTGSNGCTFDGAMTTISTTDRRYFAQCPTNETKCYWKDSQACSGAPNGYANTGDLNDALAGCCAECPTVSSGLQVGTDTLTASGGWIASGDGSTGINTCRVMATTVTDTYGTFVPGAGNYYFCSKDSSTGGGTDTGGGTGSGTGA